MDEDPRFPNRKKKRDWDEMSALDKPAGAEKPAPDGEQTEEPELPVNVYRVIGSVPKSKEEELREQAELYSFRASVETQQQPPILEAPIVQDPVYHAPEPAQAQTPPDQGGKKGIRKFFESRTKVYAAIGVGFVILIGIAIVAAFWTASSPEGRYDLGSVSSSASGLKGHLFTEWDKNLNYRLTIEPSEPQRQAAFALAVANSPHPLSIEIRLQDPEGFVLCSKEILLKFDARNAAELAAPNADAQGAKTDAAPAPGGQPAPGIDLAQADAQEAAREKGKDVFKNQVGPDGQITALNSQGAISCTARAYEKAVAWSFSPNFPTLAEQDEVLERQKETLANGGRPSAQTSAARNKMTAKPAQKLLPFSIEGDDTIVDFDTSRGIIETGAGKFFFIDKSGGAASDYRWQDYPVEIHYRCDQGSECILMHAGAGALHVRLRR
jgi:hypothetical protein